MPLQLRGVVFSIRSNVSSRPDVFCEKAQAQACNVIKKETLAQVFSCEFCKISKNTYSYRTPPVAASGVFLQKLLTALDRLLFLQRSSTIDV